MNPFYTRNLKKHCLTVATLICFISSAAFAQTKNLFTEGFGTNSLNTSSTKWKVLGSSKWVIAKDDDNKSGKGFVVSYTVPTTTSFIANTTVLTKAGVNLVAGKKYTISYASKVPGPGTMHKLDVFVSKKIPVSNISEIAADTITLARLSNLGHKTWATSSYSFKPTTSGIYYFGFHCSSVARQGTIYLDDIIIDELLPLTGTYTIGVGGKYPNIPAAVTDLTDRGVSGPVTLSLTDKTYTLTSPAVFKKITGVSATNIITFKAATPGATTITGSESQNGVIVLDGAEYVKVQGLKIINTSTNSPIGIKIFNGSKSSTVWGCEITADKATSAGARGISISGTTTSNILLANNVIQKISGIGTEGTGLWLFLIPDFNLANPYGIVVEAGINHKIYNNSINLTGTRTADISAAAALAVGSTVSGLDVRNNILANTMSSTSQLPGFNFALYSLASIKAYSNLNYNLYYTASNQKLMVNAVNYIAGNTYSSLAAWKSGVNTDGSSMYGEPAFTPESLNIDVKKENSWFTNGTGTQLPIVNTDYNGKPRSITVATGGVDLGAYEFTPEVKAPNLVSNIAINLRLPGQREVFTFAEREVCALTWGLGSLTIPKKFAIKYMPGQNVSTATSIEGTQMNSWFEIIEDADEKKQKYVFNYDFEMYFDEALMGNVDPANFTMSKKAHVSANWETYEDALIDKITKKIKKTKLSTFSYITGTDFNPKGNIVLPVTLTSFSITKQGAGAILAWSTAMEKNSLGFEIEASADAKSYTKIGFVSSTNHSTGSKYTYTDNRAGKQGVVYYRLKQIDQNGTSTYSQVISFDYGYSIVKLKAYPNPFNNAVQLTWQAEENSNALIIITGAMGKEIFRKTVEVAQGFNEQQLTIPTNNASGMYLLSVTVNGKAQTIKMFKQ